MNTAKYVSSKQAWAALSERARTRTFAFISLLGLLYKSGQLSKAEIVEKLNQAGITREDLRRFREQRHG